VTGQLLILAMPTPQPRTTTFDRSSRASDCVLDTMQAAAPTPDRARELLGHLSAHDAWPAKEGFAPTGSIALYFSRTNPCPR